MDHKKDDIAVRERLNRRGSFSETEKEKETRISLFKEYKPLIQTVLCVGGILVCFLISGFAHERIISTEFVYKNRVERFDFSVFLVASFCICNTLLVLSYEIFFNRKTLSSLHTEIDRFVIKQLGVASLSYVVSLMSSHYALNHVNYPTQILVKSAKSVPIVIGGFIQYRKVYPWYDYLTLVVVTSSLLLFNYQRVSSHDSGASTLAGVALCVLALVCDGITGPRQDRLWLKRPKVSSNTAMILMNFIASLVAIVTSLAFEKLEPVKFLFRHPEAVFYIMLYTIPSTAGQFCIFSALKLLGALQLSLITTVRKFFSVLFSVLIYRHHISPLQWSCILSVFSALSFQSIMVNKHKIKHRKAD